MSKYVDRVIAEVEKKYADEPEFVQTVDEDLSSLGPVVDAHPEYEEVALLERMVIPERVIEFRVPWEDDNGKVHVNTGYAFSSTAPLDRTRAAYVLLRL